MILRRHSRHTTSHSPQTIRHIRKLQLPNIKVTPSHLRPTHLRNTTIQTKTSLTVTTLQQRPSLRIMNLLHNRARITKQRRRPPMQRTRPLRSSLNATNRTLILNLTLLKPHSQSRLSLLRLILPSRPSRITTIKSNLNTRTRQVHNRTRQRPNILSSQLTGRINR